MLKYLKVPFIKLIENCEKKEITLETRHFVYGHSLGFHFYIFLLKLFRDSTF